MSSIDKIIDLICEFRDKIRKIVIKNEQERILIKSYSDKIELYCDEIDNKLIDILKK